MIRCFFRTSAEALAAGLISLLFSCACTIEESRRERGAGRPTFSLRISPSQERLVPPPVTEGQPRETHGR